MAGPRTTNETRDICGYAADVSGRLLGLSKAETYITDPAKRALLAEVAGKIKANDSLPRRLGAELLITRASGGIGTAVCPTERTRAGPIAIAVVWRALRCNRS